MVTDALRRRPPTRYAVEAAIAAVHAEAPAGTAARMSGDLVADLEGELKGLPPRTGLPILAAWNAKEDLLDLLATARTHPDRDDMADLLHRFCRCAEAELPELERLAATVQTWWPQILAFLHTGITNAGSVATNRVAGPTSSRQDSGCSSVSASSTNSQPPGRSAATIVASARARSGT